MGARIRSTLGVSVEDQVAWHPGYETFNRWREAVEGAGALVCQMTQVPLSEARGFSIATSPFPVIVLNIKDPPNGRVFSLFHELAHLMLRVDGLCDFEEHGVGARTDREVEVFCNMVAGATLVPAKALLGEDMVASVRAADRWDEADIERLARRYGVSREVVLRRLLTLKRITRAFYQEKREQYLGEHATDGGERPGFAPPDRVAVSAAGPFFVRLVLGAYHERMINASDVAELLDVRLKHLEKIEASVLGPPPRAGA